MTVKRTLVSSDMRVFALCSLMELHRAEAAHALFALFLLFKQFLFARNVAAVALGQNVLAHGLDRFTGNDLAADSHLHRDLEHLARDMLLELFGNLAGAGVGIG